jgi:hypothetical protein
MRALVTLHLIVFACLAGVTAVRADEATGIRSATVAECPGANAREVRLDDVTRIDGFRVDLGPQRHAGVTRVRVSAGRFERVLHVSGSGVRGLTFRPALEADHFTITLEPGIEGGCPRRVTLLDGPVSVAVVTP